MSTRFDLEKRKQIIFMMNIALNINKIFNFAVFETCYGCFRYFAISIIMFKAKLHKKAFYVPYS